MFGKDSVRKVYVTGLYVTGLYVIGLYVIGLRVIGLYVTGLYVTGLHVIGLSVTDLICGVVMNFRLKCLLGECFTGWMGGRFCVYLGCFMGYNGGRQGGMGMQESRLFRIVYYLLERGKCTAPELAERFEVSVRTIYRDIDIISSMGIPIYAAQGKGGGISLLDNFVLDRSLLSAGEKEQILMALQGIMAAEENNADELLTKLGSLFQAKTANWIEVDFSDWVKNNSGQDVFNLIKGAIFGRNVISFRYFGSNRESTERRVEPLRLVFKSKAWYLYGFCLMRGDYRFFKLTRIRDIEVQADTYSREVPSTYSAGKPMDIENIVAVTLKFDKKMAFRVYDEFADEVQEDEQGNLYVHTNLPGNDALYSYLFSFADGVEVLEPENIREQVKEKLAAMQKKYVT